MTNLGAEPKPTLPEADGLPPDTSHNVVLILPHSEDTLSGVEHVGRAHLAADARFMIKTRVIHFPLMGLIQMSVV